MNFIIEELFRRLGHQRLDTEAPALELVTGDVTDGSVFPPLITASHSTTAVPTPCVNGYIPSTGDLVSVLISGATRVCLGRLDTSVGVNLRRVATQPAGAGATVTVSWDTEDEDLGGYWTSGTNIVIPTGGAGRYGIHTFVNGATTFAVDSFCSIVLGSQAIGRVYNRTAVARLPCTVGPIFLADGNTITVDVRNAGGAGVDFTAEVWLYRSG